MDLNKNINCYIGHTIDGDTRFKASSGGIGTAIIQYLLSLPDYETSITFDFDKGKCMYVPRIIHSSEEINICGPIYHDIDIPRFLRNNLYKIKGGVVICCAPCHVFAVRQLLTKAKHTCFIISYCCSGQMTIEGTWKYYELLGINKDDVIKMQYRGNGWPSGIQIWLKDGTTIKKDNYTEPWVTIHSSMLFSPKRCFYCKRDTGRLADVALADPWLKEYIEKDKVGNTMFIPFTPKGLDVLTQMNKNNLIEYTLSSHDEYSKAQSPNIKKELWVNTQKAYIDKQVKLISKNWYYQIVTKNIRFMRIHIMLMHSLYRISSKQNLTTSFANMNKRIKRIFR